MRYKCVYVVGEAGSFFFLAWQLLDNDAQSIFTLFFNNKTYLQIIIVTSQKLFQSFIKS